MKTLFIPLLILVFHNVNSQSTSTHYKVVSFLPEQHFYLNGGTKGAFGGHSREVLTIDLPPNTVSWYYAMTSTPNQNQNVSIGLASQLTRLIDPTGGIMASAASSIIAPTGSNGCDVYLITDQNSLNLFRSRADKFNIVLADSRENFHQGAVPVRDLTRGTFYLCFRNPTLSTGMYITAEVVAVVAETEVIQKSESSQKAELYGSLGWKAYQSGDYAKCLELSKKAIALDNSAAWVQCNIGLVYLVTGQNDVTDAYVQAIELIKKSPNPKKYFEAAIKDIDEAKQKIAQLKDADMIRSLLVDQYKNL